MTAYTFQVCVQCKGGSVYSRELGTQARFYNGPDQLHHVMVKPVVCLSKKSELCGRGPVVRCAWADELGRTRQQIYAGNPARGQRQLPAKTAGLLATLLSESDCEK